MQETEIRILPSEIEDHDLIRKKSLQALGISESTNARVLVHKRSIDARGQQPLFVLKVQVFLNPDEYTSEPALLSFLKPIDDNAPRVIIVGAGPAGYFAALELLEHGIKPIVLDRGKDVRARRRDLRAIQQFGIVDPHSNYCFGEGGAGTYSDGKLYTRSHKRGSIEKALRLLVEHGAQSEILIDAHPHIGSNKLPGVVSAIRSTIEHYGGEVLFEQHVCDFILRNDRMLGVVTNGGSQSFEGEAVVLATGHSARDIYYLLHERGIHIEAKPYALGVRIEHPQPLIDKIQYRQSPRDKALPASSYKLVCQAGGRGVFSFCMCPGGLVVPAATAPGEIVVNGMSMSRRDSPYANSGTVTAIELEDLGAFAKHGVFAGLAFQQSVEQTLFQAGDGSQKAPAQRLIDFAEGKESKSLPGTSYIPGIFTAPFHQLLPGFVYDRLREGVKQFGKMMHGYYTQEAVVIGAESRTSSPVRIPRNKETYMHEQIAGLFPAGEGAGYAGGIISAAMDGQNVAKKIVAFLADHPRKQ